MSKEQEELDKMIGKLSNFINEKNDEAIQNVYNDIIGKLEKVTRDISSDYNEVSKRENGDFLLGYRRAMRVMYQDIDELLLSLSVEPKENNESDSDSHKRILTSEIIPTLKYIGVCNCVIEKDGKPFKTFGDVYISYEYRVKVLDPFKDMIWGRRYFNRIVNDFDILDEDNNIEKSQ